MNPKKAKPKAFPPDAKLVHEGIIYDVYQWPQQLYDGTTTTYERLNRLDTISILGITEDKQILLIEEEQPHRPKHITLVAGKIDPGETPLQAAERELLEETGYQAEEFIPWFTYNPDVNIDWTVHTFIATGLKKISDQKLEGGEKITPKLFTFEEFINFASSDKFHSTLIKIKVLEAKLDNQKMEKLEELLKN